MGGELAERQKVFPFLKVKLLYEWIDLSGVEIYIIIDFTIKANIWEQK